jgi:four helix bundle protein
MKQEDIKFSFENLTVWQNSIEFSKNIYELTNYFPKEEFYGLTSQIRRAAVSISLNIAEGKGRYHKKEFIQFLYLARGSLYEVITCLKLAQQLNYLPKNLEPRAMSLIQYAFTIQSQLSGLISYLKA